MTAAETGRTGPTTVPIAPVAIGRAAVRIAAMADTTPRIALIGPMGNGTRGVGTTAVVFVTVIGSGTAVSVAARATRPLAVTAAVAHVALGTTLGAVIAGPDGGAWVRIQRRDGAAIGRATPDRTFRTTAVEDPLSDVPEILGA